MLQVHNLRSLPCDFWDIELQKTTGLLQLEQISVCSVRWHVVALGNEVDIHNAHFHGNTLLMDGHRLDQ